MQRQVPIVHIIFTKPNNDLILTKRNIKVTLSDRRNGQHSFLTFYLFVSKTKNNVYIYLQAQTVVYRRKSVIDVECVSKNASFE